MQIDKQSSGKIRSIKQLNLQLSSLTKEFNKTTEQLQLLEIHDYIDSDQSFGNDINPEEISDLIRRQNEISHEIITVKKKIQKLSARTILKAELIILPILAILLFYGVSDYYQTNPVDSPSNMKTRYSIENLQGQTGATNEYWNIVQGTSLTVSIINSVQINPEKINIVKDAILSSDTLYIDNSLLGKSPSDGKTEYFKGWKGALSTIPNTKFYVPTNFNIVESSDGPGQIVIILSNLEDPDGYFGYTRSIVDNSQILKSFITIYGADKLTANQLATIVRHEFGHALGLPYTSDPQDLMHATIKTDYPYISGCDIAAMHSLYDNTNNGFCNTE
ncbi:MAG: matrixin family metalloprotease [Nitrosotalea sp.]